MRICILASVFWPIYPGQGGRHAFVLAETLAEMGHQIDVISTHPINFDEKKSDLKLISFEFKDGIRIIRIPSFRTTRPSLFRKFIFYLSFSLTSLLALPFISSDIILGLHPPPPYLIFNSFLISKLKRSKYILRVTDFWPDVLFDYSYFRWNVLKTIVTVVSRIMYNLADYILAFTPMLKSMLIGFGISEHKIGTLEMATDTDVFRSIPDIRNESGKLGLPDLNSKFVVFYSGAFALTYDFNLLLNAAKLLESEKEILFVLLGDGDSKDHIMGMIKKLSIRNVLLIPPVSGADSVSKYINCSDVCVVPLKAEMSTSMNTRPSKIFEFWACEKPVIAACEGSLAKFIDESEAGIVVEPGNFNEFADVIYNCYKNPGKTKLLGTSGRKLVLQRFSYPVLKDNLKEIIYNII